MRWFLLSIVLLAGCDPTVAQQRLTIPPKGYHIKEVEFHKTGHMKKIVYEADAITAEAK